VVPKLLLQASLAAPCCKGHQTVLLATCLLAGSCWNYFFDCTASHPRRWYYSLFLQVLQFGDNNEKVKIPGPLSQSTFVHSNVFTSILFLSEGRAGEAWEPSNKMTLLLPSPNKVSLACLVTFLFTFCSTILSPASLCSATNILDFELMLRWFLSSKSLLYASHDLSWFIFIHVKRLVLEARKFCVLLLSTWINRFFTEHPGKWTLPRPWVMSMHETDLPGLV
jgi:hypothetical protein